MPPAPTNAPYGYTKSGRIRKRPTKKQKPAEPQPEPDLKGICPVLSCKKDFQHRPHPEKAVWQHLRWYSCNQGKHDTAHEIAHRAKKSEIKTLSEATKKERQRVNAAKWRGKNLKQAQRASAKGTFKYKAKRKLKKDGLEATLKAVEDLVDGWMEEWDKNH